MSNKYNMKRFFSYGKYLLVSLLVLSLTTISVAAQAGLSNALVSLCAMAKLFLGIGVMLMILLAGATYALGQVMGAETRARATVWATAMLTGAIIGVLIYVIAPVIMNAILAGGAGGVTSATSC